MFFGADAKNAFMYVLDITFFLQRLQNRWKAGAARELWRRLIIVVLSQWRAFHKVSTIKTTASERIVRNHPILARTCHRLRTTLHEPPIEHPPPPPDTGCLGSEGFLTHSEKTGNDGTFTSANSVLIKEFPEGNSCNSCPSPDMSPQNHCWRLVIFASENAPFFTNVRVRGQTGKWSTGIKTHTPGG